MTGKSLFVLIGMMFLISCREEYDLQLESISPKLVVDASITNQKGPYLVRLTKSKAQLIHERDQENHSDTSFASYLDDGMKAVTDAEVIIKDNTSGITDTLLKCPAGIWHYYIDPNTQKDWSYFSVPDTSILRGYYKTTKIEGKSGHTYSLTIKWENRIYHSVSYLPPVPDIDSVHFNYTQAETGKDDYNIPLLYFKEPQNEHNYYLFRTRGNNRVWPYSVLSDEYLKDYVNGLDVCRGASPDYWMTDYPDAWISDYFIEMHSLTREGYEYYKALLQQFNNDGGAYSPAPATPPGNIDNGALGFFRTSSVTRIDFSIFDKR